MTFTQGEVSLLEVLGYHRLAQDERISLERFFEACALLPITRGIIDTAVDLRQARKTGLADALIAASAIVHNLVLATRNISDFNGIDGLKVINPYADT